VDCQQPHSVTVTGPAAAGPFLQPSSVVHSPRRRGFPLALRALLAAPTTSRVGPLSSDRRQSGLTPDRVADYDGYVTDR
jgi:hypothetical protein